VPDKAVISHRGEKYEIGRGRRFYGIWVVGAPYEAPVDRWPENRDGWHQAWSRFASIEVAGTITPVARQRKSLTWPAAARSARLRGTGSLLTGEGLLVIGVVLGLAGLFPAYEAGSSLLSTSYQLVPHLLNILGWALTAGLVALSVARPSGAARLGALFGLGLSAVTLGLFIADLGEVVSGGASFGTGLIVSLLGWLACTAGAALVLASGVQGKGAGPSRPVKPSRDHVGPLALLVLAAIGTAAAFLPAWDSYTVVSPAAGISQTITKGNAFDAPAMVIAGNVVFIVAVVAVAVVAALWRPARQGGLLLAGAVVALAGQVVSALLQAGQSPYPLFGTTQAQARAQGLTITSGVTPVFWVFFVFVISLLVSCAWLFTEPRHPVMHGFPGSPWLPAGGDQPTAGRAGAPRAATDSEADAEVDPAEVDPAEVDPAEAGGDESGDGHTSPGHPSDDADSGAQAGADGNPHMPESSTSSPNSL
jgi:hypothetical protein